MPVEFHEVIMCMHDFAGSRIPHSVSTFWQYNRPTGLETLRGDYNDSAMKYALAPEVHERYAPSLKIEPDRVAKPYCDIIRDSKTEIFAHALLSCTDRANVEYDSTESRMVMCFRNLAIESRRYAMNFGVRKPLSL